MILPGVSGGYLLLLLGQYVPILTAIDNLKQAVEASPGNVQAIQVLADILTRQGREAEAAEFLAQLPDLTAQALQLLALGAAQAILSSTVVLIGQADPLADRMARRLELLGQLAWAPTGTGQADHPAAELGGMT